MKSIIRKGLGAGLIALALASGGRATAAVPQRLTEQGRMMDASGAPLNASVSVTFTIWTAPTGGTALWTETQVLTIDNGYFSAELGATVPLPEGVFADVRYLGMAVGSDPEISHVRARTPSPLPSSRTTRSVTSTRTPSPWRARR